MEKFFIEKMKCIEIFTKNQFVYTNGKWQKTVCIEIYTNHFLKTKMAYIIPILVYFEKDLSIQKNDLYINLYVESGLKYIFQNIYQYGNHVKISIKKLYFVYTDISKNFPFKDDKTTVNTVKYCEKFDQNTILAFKPLKFKGYKSWKKTTVKTVKSAFFTVFSDDKALKNEEKSKKTIGKKTNRVEVVVQKW